MSEAHGSKTNDSMPFQTTINKIDSHTHTHIHYVRDFCSSSVFSDVFVKSLPRQSGGEEERERQGTWQQIIDEIIEKKVFGADKPFKKFSFYLRNCIT